MGATSAVMASNLQTTSNQMQGAAKPSGGGGGGGMGLGIASAIMSLASSSLNNGFGLWENARSYKKRLDALNQEMSAAEYDHKTAEKNAKYIQEQVNEADERLRTEQSYQRSAQMAGYGKSGVALAAGSPLAVMAETAGRQELESAELRRQGRLEVQQQEEAMRFLRYKKEILDAQKHDAKTEFGVSQSLLHIKAFTGL